MAPEPSPRPLRVIVAGAVAWADADTIARELSRLPTGSTVIHGDSPGADALAGAVAARLGLTVQAMTKSREDRRRFGRGAWKGLNERMLAAGAELVLVFHPAIADSRGSKHLVELALAAGIAVNVIDS
ncbi:SLOG family protein [Nannocystis radixulma]|uniref:SLOG family protein n=1 Tax=Nannocystis radixulma TaxID=2995305 RepID=A0ABT5BL16_9BACT|nr:SLOG family protein [Nannocystis radixulma]MDC0674840.1 SLOG family protein [Nannocystis radixulma]